MRNICRKKQINLIIMAVLSLMVLFFVPQNTQAATVKRPSQVRNLTVKLTAKNTAKLTWKKASNATKYQVYCSVNGAKYKKIKTTKGTSLTHKKLKNGATYVYKIRGINQKKTGNYSSVQRIRTLSASKPGLSVSVSGTAATLQWNKVTNATGYYVYKVAANGKWSRITTTKERSYVVKGLELGGSYTYKVVPYLSTNGKIFKGSSSTKKVTMPTSGWLLDYVYPYRTSTGYVSCNTKTFSMNGKNYTHGFTTTGRGLTQKDIYFNLGGKYSTLKFKAGICDNPKWSLYKTGSVKIYNGTKLLKQIEIKDLSVETYTVDVKGCSTLKIEVSETMKNIITGTNVDTSLVDTRYGFADVTLSK